MTQSIRLLGIPGSLRRASHNRRLLNEMAEQAKPGICLDIASDLTGVPLMNEDTEHPTPAPVSRLWAEARASDGLVFATPEYNQAIPGVTKNIVDWLSRDPQNCLAGKPVAVAGATVGLWGTLIACGCHVLPEHLFFAGANADEPYSVERLSAFVERMAGFAEAMRSANGQ